jgi:CDP-2,3-bis-(O-geranylgeranyl)-sn-glycerol synthase
MGLDRWMGEQLLTNLISALVYVLPAYVANGAPVVLVRAVERPRPLDMGRNFIDGRRILGDGKTFEGLFGGLLSGTAIGLVVSLLLPGTFRSPIEPVTLSSGAMLGDILGSFAKRRIGISQGGPLPVVDQTGFLAVALLLAWTIFGPKEWSDAFTLLLLFLVTALLHLGTNAGAYLLGLKERWY